MKKRNQYYDPITGQWLDAEDLPGGIVPDGGRVRVGVAFMDAAQKVLAGRTALEDSQDRRDAAYDAMCHGLDPQTKAKSDSFKGVQHTDSDPERAYSQYVADLAAGAYHKGATA